MTPTITDREQKLIDTVACRELWKTYTVSRISDREFDLAVEGIDTQFGKECRFSAKLMWSALHSCCDWTSPQIAGMTDYPDMAMDGDWSAVRDTDDDAKWRIFAAHVEPNIEVMAVTTKIVRKMRKA